MTAVTLLDGGMGQELIHRHGKPPTPLWSTQVMVDAPSLVGEIHADYFRAGATVATTNTYALHRDRLRLSAEPLSLPALYDTALAQAERARDAHGGGRIAGSIGPLAASYRPDLHPDHDTAVPLYAECARWLAPRVDLLIAETVASVAHGRSVLAAMRTVSRPCWIAFTVDDEDGTRLRSGERLADAVAACAEADALLANCSAPEAMAGAIPLLAQAGKPCGAYANAFTGITKDFLKSDPTVDALARRRDMGPRIYADHALRWVDLGATIVGGCCETGPAHIAAIARNLREAGHDLV